MKIRSMTGAGMGLLGVSLAAYAAMELVFTDPIALSTQTAAVNDAFKTKIVRLGNGMLVVPYGHAVEDDPGRYVYDAKDDRLRPARDIFVRTCNSKTADCRGEASWSAAVNVSNTATLSSIDSDWDGDTHLDNTRKPGCYEPHRDVITGPAQVAVYEAVMADSRGDITHVLLHADRYLKDNRLPPAGFTAARAQVIEPKTLPVGVGGDADFNVDASGEGSASDVVHYRIPAGEAGGELTVEARLLYQSIRPSFVHSMHSGAPRTERFQAMYEALPPPAEVLATVSAAS